MMRICEYFGQVVFIFMAWMLLALPPTTARLESNDFCQMVSFFQDTWNNTITVSQTNWLKATLSYNCCQDINSNKPWEHNFEIITVQLLLIKTVLAVFLFTSLLSYFIRHVRTCRETISNFCEGMSRLNALIEEEMGKDVCDKQEDEWNVVASVKDEAVNGKDEADIKTLPTDTANEIELQEDNAQFLSNDLQNENYKLKEKTSFLKIKLRKKIAELKEMRIDLSSAKKNASKAQQELKEVEKLRNMEKRQTENFLSYMKQTNATLLDQCHSKKSVDNHFGVWEWEEEDDVWEDMFPMDIKCGANKRNTLGTQEGKTATIFTPPKFEIPQRSEPSVYDDQKAAPYLNAALPMPYRFLATTQGYTHLHGINGLPTPTLRRTLYQSLMMNKI